MTVAEQAAVNFNDMPDDPFLVETTQDPDVTQFTDAEQVKKVGLEEARILWNAMSGRSFSEYRVLHPNSRGAITKRRNFARAFAALELENPEIVRGEE